MNCCICHKEIVKHGHSPKPLEGDICCNECNLNIVVPVRLFYALKDKALLITTKGNLELVKPQHKHFTLKELQKGVNGLIEGYPIDMTGYEVFVNEEGFIQELDYNRLASLIFGIDALGNVLIVPKELLE